ncbi:uncharacterized protein LOC129732292 [Wyeomyia smithii]|uniref:uncharacterized protein LOC129732292 n=1 Tax=Wyeomyia smithii TaxID=174621 RepID=UPI002467C34B|nr:uncharacterized protein LOC129732292 [Wyeomyia smithii]
MPNFNKMDFLDKSASSTSDSESESSVLWKQVRRISLNHVRAKRHSRREGIAPLAGSSQRRSSQSGLRREQYSRSYQKDAPVCSKAAQMPSKDRSDSETTDESDSPPGELSQVVQEMRKICERLTSVCSALEKSFTKPRRHKKIIKDSKNNFIGLTEKDPELIVSKTSLSAEQAPLSSNHSLSSIPEYISEASEGQKSSIDYTGPSCSSRYTESINDKYDVEDSVIDDNIFDIFKDGQLDLDAVPSSASSILKSLSALDDLELDDFENDTEARTPEVQDNSDDHAIVVSDSIPRCRSPITIKSELAPKIEPNESDDDVIFISETIPRRKARASIYVKSDPDCAVNSKENQTATRPSSRNLCKEYSRKRTSQSQLTDFFEQCAKQLRSSETVSSRQAISNKSTRHEIHSSEADPSQPAISISGTRPKVAHVQKTRSSELGRKHQSISKQETRSKVAHVQKSVLNKICPKQPVPKQETRAKVARSQKSSSNEFGLKQETAKQETRFKVKDTQKSSLNEVDPSQEARFRAAHTHELRQKVAYATKHNSKQSSQTENNDKLIMKKDIEQRLRVNDLSWVTQRSIREENSRVRQVFRKNELLQQHLSRDKDTTDQLVLDYDQKSKLLIRVHPSLVEKMKPHQKEGIKFMYDCCYSGVLETKSSKGSGCILAHCMGLGKTFQVIALVHTVISYPRLKTRKVIVVCPKSTVMNWAQEIQNWLGSIDTNVKLHTFFLPDAITIYKKLEILEKFYKLSGKDANCLLIGYEAYRALVFYDAANKHGEKHSAAVRAEVRRYLVDPGADLVVLDEGHVIKNRKSQANLALSEIATRRRIILTGTPIQNNLNEYFCMVSFVKPAILGNEKEFNEQFAKPIKDGQHKDSNKADIQIMKMKSFILHKRLLNFVQRKEFSVLQGSLPKKYEYVLYVPLTPVQEQLYEQYLKRNPFRKDVGGSCLLEDYSFLRKIWTHPLVLERALETAVKKNTNNGIDDTDNARSITNDWWMKIVSPDDLKSLIPSNKMLLLFEILKLCQERGEKCLIFSGFVMVLNAVEYFMQMIHEQSKNPKARAHGFSRFRGPWRSGIDYYRIDGASSKASRHDMITKFNDPQNRITRAFLISTKAGGFGINLVGANRVVILDTSWNPANDQQGIHRVYRLGQEKPCYIYRLLAIHTMEEKVYSRSVTKQAMSHRVADKKQVDRNYNMAELEELYHFERVYRKERPNSAPAEDDLLSTLLLEHDKLIYKYHTHERMLDNKTEQDLTDQEKEVAWTEFKKKGQIIDCLDESGTKEAGDLTPAETTTLDSMNPSEVAGAEKENTVDALNLIQSNGTSSYDSGSNLTSNIPPPTSVREKVPPKISTDMLTTNTNLSPSSFEHRIILATQPAVLLSKLNRIPINISAGFTIRTHQINQENICKSVVLYKPIECGSLIRVNRKDPSGISNQISTTATSSSLALVPFVQRRSLLDDIPRSDLSVRSTLFSQQGSTDSCTLLHCGDNSLQQTSPVSSELSPNPVLEDRIRVADNIVGVSLGRENAIYSDGLKGFENDQHQSVLSVATSDAHNFDTSNILETATGLASSNALRGIKRPLEHSEVSPIGTAKRLKITPHYSAADNESCTSTSPALLFTATALPGIFTECYRINKCRSLVPYRPTTSISIKFNVYLKKIGGLCFASAVPENRCLAIVPYVKRVSLAGVILARCNEAQQLVSSRTHTVEAETKTIETIQPYYTSTSEIRSIIFSFNAGIEYAKQQSDLSSAKQNYRSTSNMTLDRTSVPYYAKKRKIMMVNPVPKRRRTEGLLVHKQAERFEVFPKDIASQTSYEENKFDYNHINKCRALVPFCSKLRMHPKLVAHVQFNAAIEGPVKSCFAVVPYVRRVSFLESILQNLDNDQQTTRSLESDNRTGSDLSLATIKSVSQNANEHFKNFWKVGQIEDKRLVSFKKTSHYKISSEFVPQRNDTAIAVYRRFHSLWNQTKYEELLKQTKIRTQFKKCYRFTPYDRCNRIRFNTISSLDEYVGPWLEGFFKRLSASMRGQKGASKNYDVNITSPKLEKIALKPIILKRKLIMRPSSRLSKRRRVEVPRTQIEKLPEHFDITQRCITSQSTISTRSSSTDHNKCRALDTYCTRLRLHSELVDYMKQIAIVEHVEKTCSTVALFVRRVSLLEQILATFHENHQVARHCVSTAETCMLPIAVKQKWKNSSNTTIHFQRSQRYRFTPYSIANRIHRYVDSDPEGKYFVGKSELKSTSSMAILPYTGNTILIEIYKNLRLVTNSVEFNSELVSFLAFCRNVTRNSTVENRGPKRKFQTDEEPLMITKKVKLSEMAGPLEGSSMTQQTVESPVPFHKTYIQLPSPERALPTLKLDREPTLQESQWDLVRRTKSLFTGEHSSTLGLLNRLSQVFRK